MTTVQEKLILTPGRSWFSRLTLGFGQRMVRRRTYLDIRELPPHLQRDMGFLDGNDPWGPRK